MVPWFDGLFTPISKSTITVHPFGFEAKSMIEKRKKIYHQHRNSDFIKECRRTRTRPCNVCHAVKPWVYCGRGKDGKPVYSEFEDGKNKWFSGSCYACSRVYLREYQREKRKRITRHYEEKLKAMGIDYFDISKKPYRETTEQYFERLKREKDEYKPPKVKSDALPFGINAPEDYANA